MINNNEQNGRQATPTPHPQPTAPPTDPRTRIRNNAPPPPPSTTQPEQTICRDFVWGICSMGAKCKYKHELEYESMKSILRFCHDFQNKTGCERPDCTYLHTSREEENLFLQTGQIPRVLAERYLTLSSLPSRTNTEPSVATATHTMHDFIPQTQPPPPPPPLPAPVAPAIAPIAPPALPPLAPFIMRPPPPPPPTSTTTPARPAPPLFTAPMAAPPQTVPVSYTQPNFTIARFDPTRPPPPLPHQNRAPKRPAEIAEVGTSGKQRKSDASKETLCENCVQRELRIELYRQELEKLQREEEVQRVILHKKTEDYENGKLLLRSVLSPEMYRILDENIEGSHSGNSFSQSNLAPFNSGPSSVALLFKLIECFFGSSGRNLIDSIPSTSQDDTLLQSLSALARRSSTISNASPDLLQAFIEALRNSNSDSTQSMESLSNENDLNRPSTSGVSNSVSNGLNRYMEGGVPSVCGVAGGSSVAPPPRFSTASSVGRGYAEAAPAGANHYTPGPGIPQPVPPVAAPVNYMPYPPAVPPPVNRPYYAHPYPNTTNNGVHTQYAPPGVIVPQTPRPSAPQATPRNGHNYQQFTGRYPQQQYYPPFQ